MSENNTSTTSLDSEQITRNIIRLAASEHEQLYRPELLENKKDKLVVVAVE